MKLSKVLFLLVGAVFFAVSCNNDDDSISTGERNRLDDEAIVKYLREHYFNSKGISTAFDDDDTADDAYTPLYDIATQDDMGYWYVKNPNVTATGRAITDNDNDSILLQYNLSYFKSYVNSEEDDISDYPTPTLISSTINTSGYPIWDPLFYYGEDQSYDRKFYEIEGVVDGLKHFNSIPKEQYDLPAVDFQGLIIVPSRLAYARDGSQVISGIDLSIILNFELYQVTDRE